MTLSRVCIVGSSHPDWQRGSVAWSGSAPVLRDSNMSLGHEGNRLWHRFVHGSRWFHIIHPAEPLRSQNHQGSPYGPRVQFPSGGFRFRPVSSPRIAHLRTTARPDYV